MIDINDNVVRRTKMLLTVTIMVTSVVTLWPLLPLLSSSVAVISMMKVPYTASSLSLSMMAWWSHSW